MIITSYNIRGLGGNHKFLSLKRLFSSDCPDLLCIQETMAPADKACSYFLRLFPGWKVVALDAHGLSGGVLCIWNPRVCLFKAFSTVAGILLSGRIRGCESRVKILNVYGPYNERVAFWDRLAGCGLLKDPSLILVGDLNFTISPSEVWGSKAWDPLMDYFRSLIRDSGLIDIRPFVSGPTWRNGRSGNQSISKRLDRFLMAEPLSLCFQKFRVWHINSMISDHLPVCLQLDLGMEKINYPFKYNRHWNDLPEFQSLVRSFWNRDHGLTLWSPMDRLTEKLRLLKRVVKRWSKEKKKKEEQELMDIEASMEDIFSLKPLGDFSDDQKTMLSSLEDRRLDILKAEEEVWRLKSRAIWVKCGDRNTAFFHKFANFRRITNAVWNIVGTNGQLINSQVDLKEAARQHFKMIFTDPKLVDIRSQLEFLKAYPKMVFEPDNARMGAPVTLEEIERVLKICAKDKCPGPDGWTVEFFICFWDLIGPEVLALVEESRLNGHISGGLNSSFIALIPKASKATSFDDYRPIALCNFLYKIVSKIIAERFKPWLSKVISPEQYGFLKNRQIFDAVGAAQEGIHSIKSKSIKACLLKLDLHKAYDRVDWGFIRILLLYIGMDFRIVEWVMACISSVNFAVLVNGEPSGFFQGSRGLRQGCPLSPLLFILIIDGLSRSIQAAKDRGDIQGVKVSRNHSLTHLMFVDDVLLFGLLLVNEWHCFKRILQNFGNATGMEINYNKSSFSSMEDEMDPDILSLFPIDHQRLDLGIRYLGFFIKPNRLLKRDWAWLFERVEQRVGHWCYRHLSIGGRLTLIKAVLESIPVYWMTLYKVPVSVLRLIRTIAASYLWSGNLNNDKIHLVKWEVIARPCSLGGWGIKDLDAFGKALRMKSLWRFLSTDTHWSYICCDKYLGGMDKVTWFMRGQMSWRSASPIWMGLASTRCWIRPGMSWCIGSGDNIWLNEIIIDPSVNNPLSPQLIEYFRIKGYRVLSHFRSFSRSSLCYWRDSNFFRLNGDWKIQWDSFLAMLYRYGISLSREADRLRWIFDESGKVTARKAYLQLIAGKGPVVDYWWDLRLWKWNMPLKIKCFFWLLMNCRILTWDVLCRRGWQGPGICPHCRLETESALHIFTHCSFAKIIWQEICGLLNIQWTWQQSSLQECFKLWVCSHKDHPSLPLFICWGIWLHRNRCIFEDVFINIHITVLKILATYKEYYQQKDTQQTRVIPPFRPSYEMAGYFDGAAASGKGGCGFVLYLSKEHFFRGYTGILHSSNNLAELTALWSLLLWARYRKIKDLRIFGDSQLVIRWLQKKSAINAFSLAHRCSSIMDLIKSFENVSFEHIYREYNMEADILSKKGLGCPEGILQIEESVDGVLRCSSSHRII